MTVIEMKVIEFLENHSLEDLKENYGIQVQEYDDRVVLNYHMIDSPKRHDITVECRGLILRKPAFWKGVKTAGWKVLARSFDRFFNYGECGPSYQGYQNSLLHRPDVIFLEKLDGSLMNIHHDGVRWNVSSRGMAFAEGPTPQDNTFKDVFERALGCTVEERFRDAEKNRSYVFELTSPETRVVKPYKQDEVTMLAVRSLEGDCREYTWPEVEAIAREMGFKVPKKYTFYTMKEVLESLKALPELDEGYVARLDMKDGSVFRVKVKNPKYVAIAHLRGNGAVSLKRVALLVWMGDYEEYLKHFPEDRKVFDPYISAYDKMKEMVRDLSERYMSIQDQKEFALNVKDTPVAGILFALRKGKSFEEVEEKMFDSTKHEILNAFV